MTDDRMKNFIGAALDLQNRADDFLNHGDTAKPALIIALKNFSASHRSLRDLASEQLTGKPEPRGE